MHRQARWSALAYKWLPILMGCHCRPERSFHFRGRQFPVCARCTGLLAGLVVGIPAGLLYRPPAWALALMLLPMLLDGAAQRLTRYESGNRRRLLTGVLFGYAAVGLLIALAAAAFGFGFRLGTVIG